MNVSQRGGDRERAPASIRSRRPLRGAEWVLELALAVEVVDGYANPAGGQKEDDEEDL